MNIKAIETVYKGYCFRSRLEARWAVFFDALGLEWEYEPEGFDLGDGVYYLPDFRVVLPTGASGWFEVKGNLLEISDSDCAKIFEFSKYYTLSILDGVPMKESYYFFSPTSHLCGLTLNSIKPSLTGIRESCYIEGVTSPNLIQAMKAARSARFEHGEKP